MLTKNQLIAIIINSPSINNTLNQLQPAHLRDDIRQYFYLLILELPEEKLQAAYNRCDTCLEAFAGTIIRNQFKSSTSPFYKLYRENKDTTAAVEHYYKVIGTDTEIEKEIQLTEQTNVDNVLDFLRAVHPKKTTLFKEYYLKGKTIKQISQKYNIKYRTVHHTIRETEKLIKEHLKYKEL